MLIEAADRGLRHHVRLVDHGAPAHLDHARRVVVVVDAGLRQQHRLAVIERHQAGGPHQVGLAQPPLAHLRRVVGIAEEGPRQIEAARVERHDLPHRQRVGLLLHDQVGPQRLHHHGGVAGELAHRVQQARVA